jgi:ETFB lysine methyltransferase
MENGSPQNLLGRISSRYDVVTESIDLPGGPVSLLLVRDASKLLEAIDVETFAEDERLPYWAELWPSAIALARGTLDTPGLRGRKVLELGCGVGLGGITAARAGGAVTMTDYEDDALLFARYNVATNVSPPLPIVRHLDWRTPDGIGRYDVILGADIVYERRNFDPLLGLFRRVLSPAGYVMMTEPDRSIGRDFFAAAAADGFLLERRTTSVVRRKRSVTVTCTQIRDGSTRGRGRA